MNKPNQTKTNTDMENRVVVMRRGKGGGLAGQTRLTVSTVWWWVETKFLVVNML